MGLTTTIDTSNGAMKTQRLYWAIAIGVALLLILLYSVSAPRVSSDASISNSVNSNLQIEKNAQPINPAPSDQ